jgi:hypothetical protein
MAAVARQQAEESALCDARTAKRIGEKELGQNDVGRFRHVAEGLQAHASEAYRNVANHNHVGALNGLGGSFARRVPKIGFRRLWDEPVFDDVWKPFARPVEAIEIGVEGRNFVHIHRPDVTEKRSCLVHLPRIEKTNVVCVQLALAYPTYRRPPANASGSLSTSRPHFQAAPERSDH